MRYSIAFTVLLNTIEVGILSRLYCIIFYGFCQPAYYSVGFTRKTTL